MNSLINFIRARAKVQQRNIRQLITARLEPLPAVLGYREVIKTRNENIWTGQKLRKMGNHKLNKSTRNLLLPEKRKININENRQYPKTLTLSKKDVKHTY